MMAGQVGPTRQEPVLDNGPKTAALLRLACADSIRAREPMSPDMRPDICQQLTRS